MQIINKKVIIKLDGISAVYVDPNNSTDIVNTGVRVQQRRAGLLRMEAPSCWQDTPLVRGGCELVGGRHRGYTKALRINSKGFCIL